MRLPRVLFIAVLIASLLHSFVFEPTSVHGETVYTFSGTLWSGWSTDEPPPSSVEYFIPVHAGDLLDITFSYQAGTSCSLAPIDFHVGGWHYSQPPFLVSVSRTQHYLQRARADENLRIFLAIGCSHGMYMTSHLDYELSIMVIPPTSPEIPDPIITAEQAAGLMRVQVDQSLPIVIYTPIDDHQADFIDIWRLNENVIGQPSLYISAEELLALPDSPTENLLIASTPDELISVYKLTTGEFQVNVGPLADGKVHVLIFDAISPTHSYGYTWEVH